MRKASVWVVWVVILCVVFVWVSGCGQHGETVAEGHRRHLRNLRLNQESLMSDIDSFLLFDKPSRMTNKRIE